MSGFDFWPQPGQEAFAKEFRREVGGGAAITACGLATLGSRDRASSVSSEAIARLDRRAPRGATAWTPSLHPPDADGADCIHRRGEHPQIAPSSPTSEPTGAFPRHWPSRRGQRFCRRAPRPPGVSAAWDTAGRLFDAIRRNGCTLSLDVGWHEDWLRDPRALGILPRWTIFFPNEIGGRTHHGRDRTGTQCSAGFRRRPVRRAWRLKLGARGRGAAAWDGVSGSRSAPVTPIDTTGAGDCFNAGFLHSWLQGEVAATMSAGSQHLRRALHRSVRRRCGLPRTKRLLNDWNATHEKSNHHRRRRSAHAAGDLRSGAGAALLQFDELMPLRRRSRSAPKPSRGSGARSCGGWMAASRSACIATWRTAAEGADFVLNSIRVGGMAARARDERIAIEHGLAGQETTGPAGAAMALRTLPVTLEHARIVERVAPAAWFINFTNPAGLITQALTQHTEAARDRHLRHADRAVPPHRARRSAKPAAELDIRLRRSQSSRAGSGVSMHRGEDITPRILDDTRTAAPRSIPADLFDPALIQTLGLIPTEYLFFYYSQRKAYRNQVRAGASRGEELATHERRAVRPTRRAKMPRRRWPLIARTCCSAMLRT